MTYLEEHYEEYRSFAKELLYYFNPMRTQQMERAFKKYYANMTDELVKSILYKLQDHRVIMMSSDGWLMSRGKYVQLTGDSKFDSLTGGRYTLIPEIGGYVENQCNMKLIYCLWVLIDMLPASLDFALTHKPFQISFMSKKRNLYEVIYIPEIEEPARFELLSQLPSDLLDSVKNAIKRVVILENEKSKDQVPRGKGIKYILTLDDSFDSHYRVVEKREDNWAEKSENEGSIQSA